MCMHRIIDFPNILTKYEINSQKRKRKVPIIAVNLNNLFSITERTYIQYK